MMEVHQNFVVIFFGEVYLSFNIPIGFIHASSICVGICGLLGASRVPFEGDFVIVSGIYIQLNH